VLELASVVTIVLGSLAGAAALASRRTDAVLAFWLLLATHVVVPIFLLGSFGGLTPSSVLAGPAVLGALALGGAALHVGPRRLPKLLLRVGRLVLFGPLEALVTSLRARSVAALTVALACAVVGFCLLVGYLAPSDAWDGIWYHDTILGFSLQHRGFEPTALPRNLIQQANGFPRAAEATSTYLACLVDRRLVEWTNGLAVVPLVAATYGVTRRFTRRRATALGLGSLAALIPGVAVQLRSTYVDVYAAAWLVTAIHFTVTPDLDRRRTFLAALAVALLVGAKTSALATAPVVLIILAVRAFRAHGLRALAPLALGAVVVACSLAVTYGRNARLFGNPLWPYAVRAPRLGIDWPGVVAVADADQNASWPETVRAIFALHVPGRDYADVRIGGWGEAVAWVLLPLAVVGLASATLDALRRPRVRSVARRKRGRVALLALALSAPVLGALTSPALWSARYHLGLLALLAAPAAYLVGPGRRRLAAELALAAATALAAVHLARLSPPLGGVAPGRVPAYLAMSASERATRAPAAWSLDESVAGAREAELGPDSRVAFGDGVAFPSVLWNERFEGELVYVPEIERGLLDVRVRRLAPTWLVAAPGEPLHDYALERSAEWELIGMASRSPPTYAFRRRREDHAR
jgi:hypothetical protein